ncbi:putative plastoquinol--plastocyanin reductase [Helianthus annuus]|nr:putative plastoquinol--plastocyanin reductase [Helianthus annuus]
MAAFTLSPAQLRSGNNNGGFLLPTQGLMASKRQQLVGRERAMKMLLPYTYFFVPPGSGGSGGGTPAKDALGNDIIATEWLKTHGPGDRTLSQGLKGDPTYLVVENDRTLATYGINAVCTHLGCVVPWNKAENKFMCPCHGSQYNNQGKVVRGPAPLSLALAHADLDDGKVVFVPWVETDFRTGEAPWWS